MCICAVRSPPPEREGLGRVMVNGRSLDEYFKVLMRRTDVLQPFIVTDQLGRFDVRATVTGGGTTGQAQVAHASFFCYLCSVLLISVPCSMCAAAVVGKHHTCRL